MASRQMQEDTTMANIWGNHEQQQRAAQEPPCPWHNFITVKTCSNCSKQS